MRHMERKGVPLDQLEHVLKDFERRDIRFSSGRIFGSMCTAPDPLALKVHSRFHEANLGNPGLCPGTAEMEKEVIGMLGDLLRLVPPYGHVLSGGTEANITAMYLQKMRRGKGKVVYPRSAHFSVLKAIRLLDLEPVPIDLDDHFRMSVRDLKAHLTDDVTLIVAVAGSTELGAVDPVERIAEAAPGIPIHVDAAFGGFVLPFLESSGMLPEGTPCWDFSVEDVASMTVDPHKMGMSTIPAGCLLFREPDALGHLSVGSPYLTSPKAYTLAGTRGSGSVAASYAVMKHLGMEGYEGIVKECMKNTGYMEDQLLEMGLTPVMEPVMNILAVHHDRPEKVQKGMEAEGYYISKICEPPALRFVMMPHVTRDAIDRMVPVLKKVLGTV